MHKKAKNIIEFSLEYINAFLELHNDIFVYHNQRYINDSLSYCKEIAKAEGISKDDYEIGLIALLVSNIGVIDTTTRKLNNSVLVQKILNSNNLSEKEKGSFKYFLNFFTNGTIPKNTLESVLWDCKDISLGFPDVLERMNFLRFELERINGMHYDDLQWEKYLKEYFVKHSFYTAYAIKKFAAIKSKNYLEIEKRIDKLQEEVAKDKRESIKLQDEFLLSTKEREDLFKIAFRNYLNLVGLADRKAHLLIQINSILSSIIIGFTIERGNYNSILIAPGAIILISGGITIFYSILASKPLEKFIEFENSKNESFFFGSFDRLDPDFKEVTWDKYSRDITELFTGDKNILFNQLIQESYLVRKVLSKKFGYLSIAYKFFLWGLFVAIVIFLTLFVFNLKSGNI